MNKEGWISHNGSTNPLINNEKITIIYRDEVEETAYSASLYWVYKHTSQEATDIVAYKKIQNLSDWFDASNVEHIKAFRCLKETGMWPDGFIPEDVEIGPTWHVEILYKIANAYIEQFKEKENDFYSYQVVLSGSTFLTKTVKTVEEAIHMKKEILKDFSNINKYRQTPYNLKEELNKLDINKLKKNKYYNSFKHLI